MNALQRLIVLCGQYGACRTLLFKELGLLSQDARRDKRGFSPDTTHCLKDNVFESRMAFDFEFKLLPKGSGSKHRLLVRCPFCEHIKTGLPKWVPYGRIRQHARVHGIIQLSRPWNDYDPDDTRLSWADVRRHPRRFVDPECTESFDHLIADEGEPAEALSVRLASNGWFDNRVESMK